MAKKNAKVDGNAVKENMNRIWLAGLGAFASAAEEGGKLFDTLVKKGETAEPKLKHQFEHQLDKAKIKLDAAKVQAEKAWGKVEGNVDHKVTAAIHRLGVPTRDEIKELTKRVAELTSKVEELKPRTPRTRTAR